MQPLAREAVSASGTGLATGFGVAPFPWTVFGLRIKLPVHVSFRS
jgi:hypothetical protein